MISQSNSLAFPASEPTFPLSRTRQYEWFEEFSAIAQNTAISSATSTYADTKWTVGAIGGGTGIWRNAQTQQDASHFGVLQLTNSTATTGMGVYIAKGGGSNAVGIIRPLTDLFDVQIAFMLGATATNAMYFGFVGGGSQSTIPATNATTFTGLRYDTSLSDTDFMVGSQSASTGDLVSSGVAADTGWHTFRMRAAVAGTILFSIDGGTEVTVSTSINSGLLDIVLQQINRAAASSAIYVDYIGVSVANLTR